MENVFGFLKIPDSPINNKDEKEDEVTIETPTVIDYGQQFSEGLNVADILDLDDVEEVIENVIEKVIETVIEEIKETVEEIAVDIEKEIETAKKKLVQIACDKTRSLFEFQQILQNTKKIISNIDDFKKEIVASIATENMLQNARFQTIKNVIENV